jgi:CRP-like cAMP-binding protein
MFDILRAYFERYVPLREEDFALFKKAFMPRIMKKGTFLQREGETAQFGAFVTKGFLRSYIIDNKGKEHIMQFAPENWWISDKPVFSEPKPATYFIDAIEDSEVLLIDGPGHQLLMEKVPVYNKSFEIGMQKRTAAKDQRIAATLSATAEERYAEFLATYPTIAQRVPQHMLASYLGITPETVSRIRRGSMKKK